MDRQPGYWCRSVGWWFPWVAIPLAPVAALVGNVVAHPDGRVGLLAGFFISGTAAVLLSAGTLAFAPIGLIGLAIYVVGFRWTGNALRRGGTGPSTRPRLSRDVAYGTLLTIPIAVFSVIEGVERFIIDRCVGFCTDVGFGQLVLGVPAAVLLTIGAAPLAGQIVKGAFSADRDRASHSRLADT